MKKQNYTNNSPIKVVINTLAKGENKVRMWDEWERELTHAEAIKLIIEITGITAAELGSWTGNTKRTVQNWCYKTPLGIGAAVGVKQFLDSSLIVSSCAVRSAPRNASGLGKASTPTKAESKKVIGRQDPEETKSRTTKAQPKGQQKSRQCESPKIKRIEGKKRNKDKSDSSEKKKQKSKIPTKKAKTV